MNPFVYEQYLPDEAATLACAAELATLSIPPLIIFLQGILGAGKTTFTRGFLRGLNYQGTVKSPTYTLVEPYHFKAFDLFHFDFYRVIHAEELENIGLQEYFNSRSVCLIEWPEKALGQLPEADLVCELKPHGNGRDIKITAQTSHGKKILKQLIK